MDIWFKKIICMICVGGWIHQSGVGWFDFKDFRSLGSRPAHAALRRVFISWEIPPLTFFKINFDGSIMGTFKGAGFIIMGLDSRLLVVGSRHQFCHSIPGVELQTVWASIVYARHVLQPNVIPLRCCYCYSTPPPCLLMSPAFLPSPSSLLYLPLLPPLELSPSSLFPLPAEDANTTTPSV